MHLLALTTACILGLPAHAPARAVAFSAPAVTFSRTPREVVTIIAWNTEAAADSSSAPRLETTRGQLDAATRMAYPSLLYDAGVEGNAWVEVWIDQQGRVIAGCTEVRGATHDQFREGAERVANRLHFTPAQANGVAVPTHLMLLIRFPRRG